MPARAVAHPLTSLCVASLCLFACDRTPKEVAGSGTAPAPASAPEAEAAKPEGEAAKPEVEAAKPEGEAAKPEAAAAKPEGEAAKPEVEAAKPEPLALSEAELASSTSCEGVKSCVDEAILEVLLARAKEQRETTGKLERVKQTVVTSADGVELHWLTYDLPITNIEDSQYSELLCYSAIEVREGAPPKEFAHECGAECMPGGEVVDLIGSDVPEVVTYCAESNIDSIGMLDIYGLGAKGWTKLTQFTPDCGEYDPENESHYDFSREGIVLRCRTIDAEGEMSDAAPQTLKWNGSAFAPA